MNIPNLRSPYTKVGALCYFGRMVDKIRLHAEGQLPADYQPNLGEGFDARCVNLLRIEYSCLVQRVHEGGSDEEILQWAFSKGRMPSAEEFEIWNEFMRKRGWNDEATSLLQRRLAEGGFSDRTDVRTMFDYIDLDEGRDPRLRR